MKKFLMIITAVLTLALLLGEVFYPDFPLVWMASDALGLVFVRAAVVVVLAVLLFSGVIGVSLYKPALLVGAGGLVALLVGLLATDNLGPLDTVIFLETAIILSIEYLEAKVSTVPAAVTHKIGKLGVGNDFVKIS